MAGPSVVRFRAEKADGPCVQTPNHRVALTSSGDVRGEAEIRIRRAWDLKFRLSNLYVLWGRVWVFSTCRAADRIVKRIVKVLSRRPSWRSLL